MKRILPIVLTIAIVLSCLLVPVFAAEGNTGNDYTNGRYYNKILNWQNYVSSSVAVDETEKSWETTIALPQDSLWEMHDDGGAYGVFSYTNSRFQEFDLTDRDWLVTWRTPYFISVEDINALDFNSVRINFTTSHTIGYVKVYMNCYDQYMNHISIKNIGSFSNPADFANNIFDETMRWQYGQDWAGTKYIKFAIEIWFEPSASTIVSIGAFSWHLFLPFQYDPLRYPVDGIDSWMNGYFKPTVPDMDGEKDTWKYFWSQQANLTQIFQSVKDSFQHYVVGFRVWAFVFSTIINNIRLTWIKDLLLASFALGAIAFLLDIAVQGAGKVGGKGDKKKDNKKSGKSVKKERMSSGDKRKVPRDKERR